REHARGVAAGSFARNAESAGEGEGEGNVRERKNALVLFSKPPVPGLVKTRLSTLKDGVFEPDVASALYHCMLFDVVEICCAALADLEARAGAEGGDGVRDAYELIISTTPAANVEVMRELFEDAGTWPREIAFT